VGEMPIIHVFVGFRPTSCDAERREATRIDAS
jgi:hypothetical protein